MKNIELCSFLILNNLRNKESVHVFKSDLRPLFSVFDTRYREHSLIVNTFHENESLLVFLSGPPKKVQHPYRHSH